MEPSFIYLDGTPYQARNVNGGLALRGGLLETTTHGEVLIQGVEVVLAVSLRDDLFNDFVRLTSGACLIIRRTYTEELDVVEDLIVESKVVAGDDIDTGILLDLPVLSTESLSLAQELITRDLATPVSFGGLLEITELSHTGETQNGATDTDVSACQEESVAQSRESVHSYD